MVTKPAETKRVRNRADTHLFHEGASISAQRNGKFKRQRTMDNLQSVGEFLGHILYRSSTEQFTKPRLPVSYIIPLFMRKNSRFSTWTCQKPRLPVLHITLLFMRKKIRFSTRPCLKPRDIRPILWTNSFLAKINLGPNIISLTNSAIMTPN